MKRPKQLNATFVKTVRRPGRYGDGRGGHGLSLLVKPTKTDRLSKTWGSTAEGQRATHRYGTGPLSGGDARDARKKALANRRVVAQGGDPRGGGIPTFEDASERVIDVFRASWRPGGGSEKQWRSSMRRYVFPRIGPQEGGQDQHGRRHGRAAGRRSLEPEARDGEAGAPTHRPGDEWAVAQGYREDNPAGDAIGAALPKNGGKRRHFRALPHAEVAGALDKVRNSRAWTGDEARVQFMVFTATRPGETRLATWDEIDVESAT